ncbi:MAG: acetate--CoA ligase family protein [Candidatus Helarchaeota archaeon]
MSDDEELSKMYEKSNLDMFFKPRSVAIVGVSKETRKFGHVIFQNFFELNINAKIYPVNPKFDSILGFKCYKSILDIPDSLDMVIVALSRKFAVSIMKQCAEKKVRGVIFIAGGFSEVGDEVGRNSENEILRIARENNIRIIGPNVIGIYDPYSGVDTLFLPRYRLLRPKRGRIAFISQSGAFGSALLDFAASNGVGISKFISIGNAIDVDAIDALEYFEKDPNTVSIIMYLEGIKTKAKEFQKVISRISLVKPIVLLKGGVTEQGQKAAASHTGSIASQIHILQAIFKQAGVIQVEEALQLFDMGRILSTSYLPNGNRIAIVTNAGGFGVLTTDHLIRNGFKLAELSKETIDSLKSEMPSEVIISNPTDLVGNADTRRYKIALNKIAQDPNVDIIICIILLSLSYVESDIIDVINDVKITYKKPIVVTTIGGDFTQMMIKMMEENNIPTFPDPKRTVSAVKALVDYSVHCSYHVCRLE